MNGGFSKPTGNAGRLMFSDLLVAMVVGARRQTNTPVARGSTATCLVSRKDGLPAVVKKWKFEDADKNVVISSSSSPSWAGTAVKGGTITVTMNDGSARSTPLIVTPRTGWAFQPVAVQQVGDGFICGNVTFQTVKPIDGSSESLLGAACLQPGFGPFKYSGSIASGPNAGYQYILQQPQDTTQFPVWYSHELDNNTTDFCLAQCPTSTTARQLSCDQIRSNLVRHESSQGLNTSNNETGHYGQYVDGLNDDEANLGISFETIIGLPSDTAFSTVTVPDQMKKVRTKLLAHVFDKLGQTISDPGEPPGLSYDANGNFMGFINFAVGGRYPACPN